VRPNAETSSASRRPRPIARLTTIGCHALSKAETLTIAAIENAREIIAAFQAIETSASPKTKLRSAPRSPWPWLNGQSKVRSPSV